MVESCEDVSKIPGFTNRGKYLDRVSTITYSPILPHCNGARVKIRVVLPFL